MWYLHRILELCTLVVCACSLLKTLSSRFRAILKSFRPQCSTYWYDIERDTTTKLDTNALQFNMASRLPQSTYEFWKNFTKGNDVKHTLIVSYQPRWNDQEERFVQTFKQCFKAEGRNSIKFSSSFVQL